MSVPEVTAPAAATPHLHFQARELLGHLEQVCTGHRVGDHALQGEVIVAVLFTLISAHLRRTDATVFELPGAAHDPQVALFILVLQPVILRLDEGFHVPAELGPTAEPARDGLRGPLGALIRQVLVQDLGADPLQALARAHHEALGTLLGLVVLLLGDNAHGQLLCLRGARPLGNAASVEDLGVAVHCAHTAFRAQRTAGALAAPVRAGGVRGQPELLGVFQWAAQGAADDTADAAAQLVIGLLFSN